MNIKKSIITGGVLTTVGLTSILGLGLVSAQSDSSGMSGLVDKIAQKFNLNKADVQAVFDQDRATHQADRQAKAKEQLDQAVKDGKLTQAQEDKIIAKRAELEAKITAERDALKDKTATERKTLMDQKRTELEKWATDNNIPLEYLHPGGHGGGHGPGMNGKTGSSPAVSN